MATFKGLKGKVEEHGGYQTPRRIYDIESKPSRKDPQAIAEAALKKAAGSFKIKPDLSRLLPNAERGNKRAGAPFEEIGNRARRKTDGDLRGK